MKIEQGTTTTQPTNTNSMGTYFPIPTDDCSYYMLQTWSNNVAIAAMLAAIAVAILITAIISRYWKISAHAVGIGGLCGCCALLNLHYLQPNLFMVLIVSILLAGIVLSSRVYLQAHTLSQVYAGWVLGAGVCVSSIVFL